MLEALRLAEQAAQHGDVPVGAVVIDENGVIIGRGKNERELQKNPLAHAECLAIVEASKVKKEWNLKGCQLIVTLEPCLMCTGVIVNSRIQRAWFGTPDPKGGAMISNYAVAKNNLTNHKFEYSEGILQNTCSEILTDFFKKLRK